MFGHVNRWCGKRTKFNKFQRPFWMVASTTIMDKSNEGLTLTIPERLISVTREHNDFIWLYNRLVETKKYYGLVVPPAPPRFEAVELQDVEEIIARHELFLLRLANHQIFKCDCHFRRFLLDADLYVQNTNVEEENADLGRFCTPDNYNTFNFGVDRMISCHNAVADRFDKEPSRSLPLPNIGSNELELKMTFQTTENLETYPESLLVYIVHATLDQNFKNLNTLSSNKTSFDEEFIWQAKKSTPKSTYKMCEKRTRVYMHQLPQWPYFYWDQNAIQTLLSKVNSRRQTLLTCMKILGMDEQDQTVLRTLTLDVVKSSAIEGDDLCYDQVRSSIGRRLKIETNMKIGTNESVESVVSMMLDGTQKNEDDLTVQRLFKWHSELFPSGGKFVIGAFRDNKKDDPMEVVSGEMGRQTVHFTAPDSSILNEEMNSFLHWFNTSNILDPIVKAAIAHIWFVTIHPFDDGNGRIVRAITDMLLARGDKSPKRCYSMSAQIFKEKNDYYAVLEKTQLSLNVTEWLKWFLGCLECSLSNAQGIVDSAVNKAKFWQNHSHKEFNKRQTNMLNQLLGDFHGKLTIKKWARMEKCSQFEAEKDLDDLASKTILIQDNTSKYPSYVLKN